MLRSGLLREPAEGHADFVHRTFQEHLAAKALICLESSPDFWKVGEELFAAQDRLTPELVLQSYRESHLHFGLRHMRE